MHPAGGTLGVMDSRWLGWIGAAVVLGVACGGSDSTSTTFNETGPVITGVGGGSTTTSTTTVGSVVSSSSGGGMGGMGGAAATTTTTTTTGSGGEPPVCNDAFSHEMNESELTAHELENQAIDECDSSGGSVQGVIAGPDDVDWFTYVGDDTLSLCQVDPAREITQSQSGIRLCKFIDCEGDPATVGCGAGSSATSPEGLPGCCHSSGFNVDLNCPGTLSEDATVYIRIDQPGATASTCNEYTLNYHF